MSAAPSSSCRPLLGPGPIPMSLAFPPSLSQRWLQKSKYRSSYLIQPSIHLPNSSSSTLKMFQCPFGSDILDLILSSYTPSIPTQPGRSSISLMCSFILDSIHRGYPSYIFPLLFFFLLLHLITTIWDGLYGSCPIVFANVGVLFIMLKLFLLVSCRTMNLFFHYMSFESVYDVCGTI